MTTPEIQSSCGHDTEEMFLHSRCHTDMPTWTRVNTKTGVLTVICCVCDKPVQTFQLEWEDKS